MEKVILSVILSYIFKEGFFALLPPTPRPIRWMTGSWSSWRPGELSSPPSPEDTVCLWKDGGERELTEHALHELGHALYTPTPSQNPVFWEEYRRLGDILNLVEDLRIERRLDQVLGEWRSPSSTSPLHRLRYIEEAVVEGRLGEALLSALLLLHATYFQVEKLKEARALVGYKREGVRIIWRRAERIYRRLLHASPSSAVRLARWIAREGGEGAALPLLGDERLGQVPKDAKEIAPAFASSGREEEVREWFSEEPLPPPSPKIRRLLEALRSADVEWEWAERGHRISVSRFLAGAEDPFLRREEREVEDPLWVVDCSGSMKYIEGEARELLSCITKLKGELVLVKNVKFKRIKLPKSLPSPSFDGGTEGLMVVKELVRDRLTFVVSDLQLSRKDAAEVRKFLSHRPNIYWVYWGKYKGEFLESAAKMGIPKKQVVCGDTLEEVLRKLKLFM